MTLGEHQATIQEIQTGQIDRGASLKWISQFPHEDEHVIVPLCNYEIVGVRRELIADEESDEHGAQIRPARAFTVNVLEVKLNMNLNAPTLEQLRGTRKACVVNFCRSLIGDASRALSGSELNLARNLGPDLLGGILEMHDDEFRDAGAFRKIINACFARWRDTLAGAANDIQRFISSVPPTDPDAAARIRSAIDTVDAIHELIAHEQTCSHCGRSDHDDARTASLMFPSATTVTMGHLAVDSAGNVMHVSSNAGGNSFQGLLFCADLSSRDIDAVSYTPQPFHTRNRAVVARSMGMAAAKCGGIARDAAAGLLYIADYYSHAVHVFDAQGHYQYVGCRM